MDKQTGMDTLFPKLSPCDAGVTDASDLSPGSASDPLKILRDILALPPLSMTKLELDLFTRHSLRHFPVEFTRISGWPPHEQAELLRWSHLPKDLEGQKSAMPLKYSSESAPARSLFLQDRMANDRADALAKSTAGELRASKAQGQAVDDAVDEVN